MAKPVAEPSNDISNEDFFSNLLIEHFMEGIPTAEGGYHYTDCNGLISIVREREFWLSNAMFMNDVLENEKSIDSFLNVLSEMQMTAAERNAFIKSFTTSRKRAAPYMFVLSLSMDNDSLILWNNYGKTEGYNVGLDVGLLTSLTMTRALAIKDHSGELKYEYLSAIGRVQYDESRKKEFFRLAIERYRAVMRKLPQDGKKKDPKIHEELARMWRVILMYSYMMKQSEHKAENEFRVVINVPDRTKVINFRNRNGLVLPYIRFCSGKDSMPIHEVTIGPKIDDEIASLGVQSLAEQYNLLVNLKKSKIRLRF